MAGGTGSDGYNHLGWICRRLNPDHVDPAPILHPNPTSIDSEFDALAIRWALMLGGCLEDAWRMLGGCLEDAWRMLG